MNPAQYVERPADAVGVARWLEEAGVAAVALGFVDPSAIVRVKTVPVGRFADVVTSGVGLSTLFNVAMSNDSFALLPGSIDGPSGDLRLRPDPGATVPLAALPGWAWAPVDQYTQQGEPFPACPRMFARRVAEGYPRLGLSVRAAFELEFSIGHDRDDGAFDPAHRGPGYSDIALVGNHDFALDLITAMEAQGLRPAAVPSGVRDGQFEMSIAPRDPVAAADAAMVFRQTVRAVARPSRAHRLVRAPGGGRDGQRHASAPQPLGRARTTCSPVEMVRPACRSGARRSSRGSSTSCRRSSR